MSWNGISCSTVPIRVVELLKIKFHNFFLFFFCQAELLGINTVGKQTQSNILPVLHSHVCLLKLQLKWGWMQQLYLTADRHSNTSLCTQLGESTGSTGNLSHVQGLPIGDEFAVRQSASFFKTKLSGFLRNKLTHLWVLLCSILRYCIQEILN